MSDLAINLKKLREEKGLSQYQLAAELGIKRSAYGNYETGMSFPEYDILKMIAEYYKVDIKELLGLDNSKLNIEKEAKELMENIREYYYKKYRKIPDDITLNKIIKFLFEN